MTETHLFALIYLLTFLRLASYLMPSVLTSIQRAAEGSVPEILAPTAAGINEFIDSIIYAGAAALFLIHFVVRSFYIPSESMIHTLEINDYIIVNEMVYDVSHPQRGDIAVFHPPNPVADHTDLIKRVIGIEGDEIEVKDGAVYRNGEKLDEPYLHEPIFDVFPKHRVEKGKVFMMGDNRNNSEDSRYIGDIPIQNFVGRAELIFWPPKRAHLLH